MIQSFVKTFFQNNVQDSDNVVDNSDITSQALSPELLDSITEYVHSQANNSAVLAGAVLGTGEVPNSSTHKSVQVNRDVLPFDMQILHAMAYEPEPGSSAMILHMRNASGSLRCRV